MSDGGGKPFGAPVAMARRAGGFPIGVLSADKKRTGSYGAAFDLETRFPAALPLRAGGR